MELLINGKKVEIVGGDIEISENESGDLKITVSAKDKADSRWEKLMELAKEWNKSQPAPPQPVYPGWNPEPYWRPRQPIWISPLHTSSWGHES